MGYFVMAVPDHHTDLHDDSSKSDSSQTQLEGNLKESYNLGHKGWKKIILYTFCPSPPLSNVNKTLSSNTSLYFTFFQHWMGEWGCWHSFCRYYDYDFMILAFSNTICPWL